MGVVIWALVILFNCRLVRRADQFPLFFGFVGALLDMMMSSCVTGQAMTE